jgi:hypothetical protein
MRHSDTVVQITSVYILGPYDTVPGKQAAFHLYPDTLQRSIYWSVDMSLCTWEQLARTLPLCIHVLSLSEDQVLDLGNTSRDACIFFTGSITGTWGGALLQNLSPGTADPPAESYSPPIRPPAESLRDYVPTVSKAHADPLYRPAIVHFIAPCRALYRYAIVHFIAP